MNAALLTLLLISAMQPAGRDTLTIDTLSGNCAPALSHIPGRAYLVTADLVIPPGQTTVIEQGTVVLFKNFTGLLVEGTLIARGTAKNPVVFTSENDTTLRRSDKTPAPYDWNGITISEASAGSSLQRCQVRYSLFGINSLTGFITLDSCFFLQNGKSDLTIAGKEFVPVQGKLSYGVLSGAQPVKRITSAPSLLPRYSTGQMLRGGGALLFVGGLAAGIIEAYRFRDANRTFEKLNDPGNSANLLSPTIVGDWNEARRERDLHMAGVIGFAACALTGGVLFTLSFHY